MAEVKLKIVPFTVPDDVSLHWPPGKRQDGIQQDRRIPLRDLSEEALNELADEFRFRLFEKAEKKVPTNISSPDKQALANFFDAAIKLQQEYQNNRVSTGSTRALDNFAEASLRINSIMARIKVYG